MAKTRRRTSDPDPDSNTGTVKTRFSKLSSLSLKSVSLYDWWLFKAADKGLAVGGIASRGSLGGRAFCSTAITKRHDTTTLETADGITITISGLINRSRTHLNGFPLEVCSHFLLGFPYYWEEYAKQFSDQEYASGGIPSRVSCFDEVNMSSSSDRNTFQPVSLNDIPTTKICDLLMSPGGDSENSVLHREILDALGEFSSGYVQDENPNNCSKIDAGQLSRTVGKRKEYKLRDQTKGADILTPNRGVVTRSMAKLSSLQVVTRSMARLRNLANEKEANFSSMTH